MEKRQRRYVNRVQPGETGFFTTTVVDFVRAFERPELKDEMVRSLLADLQDTGCELRAFVVMSHHIHFVATLPEDLDGSALMCRVKSNSARRLLQLMNDGEHPKFDDQRGLNGRAFWKVSFRSLPLYTGTILEQKINYTHLNPVRAHLRENVIDYRWSSVRFWEEEKYVSNDYCLNIPAVLGEFALGGTLLELASTDSCEEGEGRWE
jgi:REP element-mobilizing transposase RayT